MSTAVVVRLVRRAFLTAALLATALIVPRTPVPVVQASVPPQQAQQPQVVGSGPNRAAIAIKFGDGHVESRCVRFTEQDIGGDELLQRSGLAPAISPEGAVCSIEGQGCPTDDCFCRCQNFQDCQYWAFYQWGGDGWIYSQFGVMAETVVVSDGGMHGWSWGSGDADNGAPAPDVLFDDICSAAATENTGTPTATPTATATATWTPAQGNEPSAAPQVSFSAATQSLVAQQCTTLNWQTTNAASVTLDGATVTLSGTERVCPSATQTWTLVATNAAGQTTRQVSIQVTAIGAASPTPPIATPQGGQPTPIQRPVVTQAPRPLPPAGQPGTVPTPDLAQSPLPSESLEGGVPLAPTAALEPLVTATPLGTPTRYSFSLPPTETPRPRRVLAAGGPTPTPLLVARAGGSSGQAPGAKAANRSTAQMTPGQQLVQARAFTPQLLPQYAAYIVAVAALLVMGWFALRRRSGRAPIPVREAAQRDLREPRDARASQPGGKE